MTTFSQYHRKSVRWITDDVHSYFCRRYCVTQTATLVQRERERESIDLRLPRPKPNSKVLGGCARPDEPKIILVNEQQQHLQQKQSKQNKSTVCRPLIYPYRLLSSFASDEEEKKVFNRQLLLLLSLEEEAEEIYSTTFDQTERERYLSSARPI